MKSLLTNIPKFSFANQIKVHNPNGKMRVVVTKQMPGTGWVDILTNELDARVEVGQSKLILSHDEICEMIGDKCDAVIGQLTEPWKLPLFEKLKQAGGRAYSNQAVGFDNVHVPSATQCGIPVGNTPGVLTDATADIAFTLTMSAGRRIVEADSFMRNGHYKGWLPDMYVGSDFSGKTLGIIGCGRIGAAYATKMVRAFEMNLVYYDMYQNKALEDHLNAFSKFIGKPLSIKQAGSIEEVMTEADIISIHTLLSEETKHLINKNSLKFCKKNALLVNTSRGPCVNEADLVEHLQNNPEFRVGLDVYEREPIMADGLNKLDNAIILPHIASATFWTRSGMSTLAARNITAMLKGHKANNHSHIDDISKYLHKFDTGVDVGDAPKNAPSIVNAKELGLLA